MPKPIHSAKRTLERLRSHEATGALAADLGVRDAEVVLAREVVRHIGEHQATAAARLPDPLAQAVVEAALQIEHAEFLKAVAEAGTRAASSAAKRGLAILRSRGIEVDLAPRGEAVFKAEPVHDELPCFVSTPDPGGERIVWISRSLRGGGLQLLTILLSDQTGILQVTTDEISRKSFRRLREDLSGRTRASGIALLQVSLERAKGYLALGHALSPGLDIGAAAQLTGLIGDPAAAASPTRELPPLPPAAEARRLGEGGLLLAQPELRGWSVDPRVLQALSLRLQEIATSQLYVDEPQRAAQVEREIERAAEAYLDDTRRPRLATRLFELAEILLETGRHDSAERALATGRALKAGTPASALPFIQQLFRKLLEKPPAAPDADLLGASNGA